MRKAATPKRPTDAESTREREGCRTVSSALMAPISKTGWCALFRSRTSRENDSLETGPAHCRWCTEIMEPLLLHAHAANEVR